MNQERRRLPLDLACELGSANHGAEQWWMERVTAIALVPLTVWFVASLIAHVGSDHGTVTAWLRTPIVSILMILLLVALFYHAALGLQVVIEDYVHSKIRFAVLICTHSGCFAFAVAGIWATLCISFGD